MLYKRVLLKLSGESLIGDNEYGIDSKMLSRYAQEINSIVDSGMQIAIVIGEEIFIEGSNLKELVLIEFKEIIWVC